VEHFLAKAAKSRNKDVKKVNPDAMKVLVNYNWPGNIRELENEIERFLILGIHKQEYGLDEISQHIKEEVFTNFDNLGEPKTPLKQAIEDVERKVIYKTLQNLDWNKSLAAKALGISRSNLIQKVHNYGFEKIKSN
jgi:two-component system, NtrC family, response regulator HupR/HoxA